MQADRDDAGEAPYPGSAARGEIEIVSDPDAVRGIAEERRRAVAAGELASADAAVGRVFEDEYVVVHRDPVRFPDGSTGTYLRIVERAGLRGAVGVAVVPVYAGRVFLRANFRHPTRSWEIEIPRGYQEPGSSVEETVRHELREELGAEPAELHAMGEIHTNSGLLAGAVRVFWARLSGYPGRAPSERTEALGAVHAYDRAGLADAVRSGAIRDGVTLAAIALAQAHGKLAELDAGASR